MSLKTVIKQGVVSILFFVFFFFNVLAVAGKTVYDFSLNNRSDVGIDCNYEYTDSNNKANNPSFSSSQKSQVGIYKLDFSSNKLLFSLECAPQVNPKKNDIWVCAINNHDISKNNSGRASCGTARAPSHSPTKKYQLILNVNANNHKLMATFQNR